MNQPGDAKASPGWLRLGVASLANDSNNKIIQLEVSPCPRFGSIPKRAYGRLQNFVDFQLKREMQFFSPPHNLQTAITVTAIPR